MEEVLDFYFLPLKPDLLPVIINEIDRLCEKHKGMKYPN